VVKKVQGIIAIFNKHFKKLLVSGEGSTPIKHASSNLYRQVSQPRPKQASYKAISQLRK